MKIRQYIRVLVAGATFCAATAHATDHPLSLPGRTAYADTESSVTMPLPRPDDLTRIFQVRFELGEATSSSFSGEATSSSLQNKDVEISIRSDGDVASPTDCCVQVAFGRDADGDGNLGPAETDLVCGVDCGEGFARDERSVEQASSPAQLVEFSISIRGGEDASSTTIDFTIPRHLFDRTWNAAKVTTRGFGRACAPRTPPSATITLIYKNTPMIIRIR